MKEILENRGKGHVRTAAVLVLLACLVVGISGPGFAQGRQVQETDADYSWYEYYSSNTVCTYEIFSMNRENTWIVGEFQDSDENWYALIMFHDGQGWELQAAGEFQDCWLEGVHAIAADHVWAVGEDGSAGEDDTTAFIIRYDGTNWTRVNNPLFDNFLPASVTAEGADNVWIAGKAYDAANGRYYAAVLHFDGAVWTRNVFDTGGHAAALAGISSSSENSVWAAGTLYNQAADEYFALICHYDGTAWDVIINLNWEDIHLNAIEALAPDQVWAAGRLIDDDPPHDHHSIVMFYNGTSWSRQAGAEIEGTELNGLSALDRNHVWAVGTRNPGKKDYQAAILYYDGEGWTTQDQGRFAERVLFGVSATSRDKAMAVGTDEDLSNGTILGTGPLAFFFAEGYTGAGFQTYLCLGNAGTTEVLTNVTYLFTDGTQREAEYAVPPMSRFTVDVNTAVGAGKEVSIRVDSPSRNIVAERPMYFNYQGKWTGGSDAIGASHASRTWYFAEGTTRPGFDQYVTVLNPGDAPVALNFHYQVEGEGEMVVDDVLGGHTRGTYVTRDQVGSGKDLSLKIVSDKPVVAERPVYFDYAGTGSYSWTGGHNVLGVTQPVRQSFFAEGTTRRGFEEWLCIQNPGNEILEVNVVYQFGPGQGDPMDVIYQVDPLERKTVFVNQEIGEGKDVSIRITSEKDFIAERPLYFNYGGWAAGGHDVMGVPVPATEFFFAEGYTGPGFEQWFSIQNPGNNTADVNITYYPETGGEPIQRTHAVAGKTRLTVPVNVDAGSNRSISTRITSSQPVVAERPMYFIYQGWAPGGHTVAGFVPGR